MTLAVQMKRNLSTADTGRGPSPNIWGDCPILSILEGSMAGSYLIDDFVDFPLAGTQTTQIAHGRYKIHSMTTGVITGVSTVNSLEVGHGVLKFQLTADDDSSDLAQAYPSFLLTSTAGKLWFEARLCQSSIADNTVGWFLGLTETELFTLADNVPFNGASATLNNSGSMIGFKHEEGGLGKIDTCYNDRATSLTDIEATVDTVAAYEWVKLGMVFDPDAVAAERIKFYVNNLETGTKMTNAVLTALTNLDANALGVQFSTIADSAFGDAYLDWWRCVQLG